MARFKGGVNLGAGISGLSSAGQIQAQGLAAWARGLEMLGAGIGGGLSQIGQAQQRKREIGQQRQDRAAELQARRDERNMDKRFTLLGMQRQEVTGELNTINARMEQIRNTAGMGDPEDMPMYQQELANLTSKAQTLNAKRAQIATAQQQMLGAPTPTASKPRGKPT